MDRTMNDSVPIRAGWTVCDDCAYTPGASPDVPCCCEYATSGALCPDHIAARAAAGLTEPPCIAGDHEPNDAGTACRYCGLPAEPGDPQELAEALYFALQLSQDRDRWSEALAGGAVTARTRADALYQPAGWHPAPDMPAQLAALARWHRADRIERDA